MEEDITEETFSNNIVSETDNNNLSSNDTSVIEEISKETKTDCGCGSHTREKNSPNYIYALGNIRFQFPNKSLEKEFQQLIRLENTANQTDSHITYNVLKNNKHIAREMCWIFTIETIDMYLIIPRDNQMLDELIESIRPRGEEEYNIDLIIGERGEIAPLEVCNLAVPIVVVDKIYSFIRRELIKAIPKAKEVEEKSFRTISTDLFNRINQLADNSGASDEHRAINYLAVRYPEIYTHATHMTKDDYSLQGIEVISSRLSGITQKLVNVIITYTHRKTMEIRKYYIRVDITGKYPFLHSPITQFIDRV
jgi:hypothetical protein